MSLQQDHHGNHVTPGDTAMAEACMLTRGCAWGQDPGTLGRLGMSSRTADNGAKVRSPRCMRGCWTAGISLSRRVLFFLLFPSSLEASRRGAGRASLSAVLGARLAAAVPYSIF